MAARYRVHAIPDVIPVKAPTRRTRRPEPVAGLAATPVTGNRKLTPPSIPCPRRSHPWVPGAEDVIPTAPVCWARAIPPGTDTGDNPVMPRSIPCAIVGLVAAVATPSAPALESRVVDSGGAAYRIVTLDLAHDRLEVHWKDDAGHAFAGIEALRAWGEAHGRVLRFATNAGIYDADMRPLGLYIEGGRTLRPLNTVRGDPAAGNFSIAPNGVFYVDTDGHAGVVPTTEWKSRAVQARLASQSGPMLVIDGAVNPAFIEDSDSLKWRNGVCAPTPDRVVFAVSEVPVNFHDFAQLFRDVLGCRDALYLDGTLSRIYTATDGYTGALDMLVKPYVAMFAVFDAPAKSEPPPRSSN